MTKTAACSDAAGRCVRWFRPHPWTRWSERSASVKTGPAKETVASWLVQVRICTRCGLTERKDL
jgi:hypothetical protein